MIMNKTLTVDQFIQITRAFLEGSEDVLTNVVKIIDSDLDENEIKSWPTDKILEYVDLNYLFTNKIEESFEVDGVTFTLGGNAKNFKFSARQMMKIKAAMIKDKAAYTLQLLEAVYNHNLTTSEALAILRNAPVVYVMPFIYQLNKMFSK